MSIEFIKGNILEAFANNDVGFIIQVVNCQGVQGAGLAKQIRDQYPVVYKEYKDFCEEYGGNLLGHYISVHVGGKSEPHYMKRVGNLFAQDLYGTHKRQLNYGALANGFKHLRTITSEEEVIGIPYGIGCGLAGGSWEIVLEMIEFFFRGHDVKIYQL
jgi:O-acetyl-ADP-ribose deacetylase (regulator of RNase III)